jgi:hypothetical protein
MILPANYASIMAATPKSRKIENLWGRAGEKLEENFTF